VRSRVEVGDRERQMRQRCQRARERRFHQQTVERRELAGLPCKTGADVYRLHAVATRLERSQDGAVEAG
jgi:hypothetical protein